MVSCTVCRRLKEPRAKVVSTVFATTVGKTAKVGQLEGHGQMARVGVLQAKVGSNKGQQE